MSKKRNRPSGKWRVVVELGKEKIVLYPCDLSEETINSLGQDTDRLIAKIKDAIGQSRCILG